MERNVYFDVIKGIAIILVAFGHSLQAIVPDVQNNKLFLSIYMFHMPLFMLVSGYFYYPSVTKMPFRSYIYKKFKHLYLPSLVWGSFLALLIGGGKMLLRKQLELMPLTEIVFTGMWFLTVLFVLHVVGALIEKTIPLYKYIGWLIAYLIVYAIPCDIFMSRELKFMLPFFVFGIIWKESKVAKFPHYLGLICIAIYLTCLSKFTFEDTYYSMSGNVFTTDFITSLAYTIISGIVGCIAIIYQCQFIIRFETMNKLLIRLGCLTLPIYVLHQFLLKPFTFIHWNDIMLSLIPSGISLLISFMIIEGSIAIYRTIKAPILKLCLFGEESNQ